MEAKNEWFYVADIDQVDSPALIIYADRVNQNIKTAIDYVGDVQRLRPHIKTHKSPQVCKLMLDAGITKFKCATIAEAEMLAAAGATDVLLAYQPVGPKVSRLAELADEFPTTTFSCLIDNIESASYLSSEFLKTNSQIRVYIDLNVGMNRTGIKPESVNKEFIEPLLQLRGILLTGLHAYDGHLRDENFDERKKKCDLAFADVERIRKAVKNNFNLDLNIIAGGTPTFSIHCKRKDIECSPGTFIYWDKGYDQILAEQKFVFAALVMTRVISKPADKTICVDLGHKAIASENPLTQRVYFLNAADLQPVGHSEEHMVFTCNNDYKIGHVLYGVPHHICPTVALHDQAVVIDKQQKVADHWLNISRNRKLTI
jgi:D-threonine aldolase